MLNKLFDHLVIIFLILIMILAASCSVEPIEIEKEKVEVKKYKYKVPSYEWDTFTPQIDYANILSSFGYSDVDKSNSNTSLAIADFNQDGYLDLYFQSGLEGDEVIVKHNFLIYIPEVDTYTQEIDFKFDETTTALLSRKTIVGDFNNDNKPDVIRVAGAHDNLDYPNITLSDEEGYVLKNINDAPLSQFHTVSSGDIDNDGDLDLFFAHNGHQDTFAINRGNGEFDWVAISQVILNFEPEEPTDLNWRYGIWTSEMFDFNEDGFMDLVLAGTYPDPNSPWEKGTKLDGITILLGSGNGKFDYNNSLIALSDERIIVHHDVGYGDVDGDGFNELFSMGGTLDNREIFDVYKNNNNATLNYYSDQWIEGNVVGESIKGITWLLIKDIDKDGYLDITENESTIFQFTGTVRNALRWEWNGKKFKNN